MPSLAAIGSWQRIQQTREATLTNPSRVALAVHLAKTCDSRSCCCCCCCRGLLVGNVQTITQQQQQSKLKQNHRTLLDCCRALFVLCFLSCSYFFLFFFFGQEPFSLSWTVQLVVVPNAAHTAPSLALISYLWHLRSESRPSALGPL